MSAVLSPAAPALGFIAQFEAWALEVAIPTLRRQCLLLERKGVETGYDSLRGQSVRFYARHEDASGRKTTTSLSFTPAAGERAIAVREGTRAAALAPVAALDESALAELAAGLIARLPR